MLGWLVGEKIPKPCERLLRKAANNTTTRIFCGGRRYSLRRRHTEESTNESHRTQKMAEMVTVSGGGLCVPTVPDLYEITKLVRNWGVLGSPDRHSRKSSRLVFAMTREHPECTNERTCCCPLMAVWGGHPCICQQLNSSLQSQLSCDGL
jgi:hypothetical protein